MVSGGCSIISDYLEGLESVEDKICNIKFEKSFVFDKNANKLWA